MADIQPMYLGLPYSPETTLAQNISAGDVTFEVADGSKLPDAPNIATIGIREQAETIFYASKSGNLLSNVTRGYEDGGTGKEWTADTPIAGYFTAGKERVITENIILLNTSKLETTGIAADSGKLNGQEASYYATAQGLTNEVSRATAEEALKADKTELYYPNMLINADFKLPVNQRRQNSYTGIGYTIDRWYTSTTTTRIDVLNGYLRLSATAVDGQNPYFRQRYERGLLDGTYTLSAKVRGSGQGLIAFQSSGATQGGQNFNIPSDWQIVSITSDIIGSDISNSAALRLTNTDSNSYMEIQSIKLEEANVSTLANDPPQDYGIELSKCLRYQQTLTAGSSSSVGTGFAISSTAALIYIPLMAQLSKSPTISYNGTWVLEANGHTGGNGYPVTEIVLSFASVSMLKLTVRVGSGLTAGEPVALGSNGSPSQLLLDSNT